MGSMGVSNEDTNDSFFNQEDVPYFIGTLAKIVEGASSHNDVHASQKESRVLEKDSGTYLVSVVREGKKNDHFLQQLRFVISALYHACSKVNAALLIERIEARLHLATMVVPGLLGRCFDCVVARALPRYFAQEGVFYSYQHDPYIIEDLITLLQHQYLLPNNQRIKLQILREEIKNHPCNKRLGMMIYALQRKDTHMLEIIAQPYNSLIAMMYQEIVSQ